MNKNGLLLTSGYDGKVKVWDESLKKSSSVFISDQNPITCLSLHESTIYVGTLSSEVYSVNFSSGKVKESESKRFDIVDRIVFNKDGNSFFASGQNFHVEEFDTDDMRVNRLIPGPIDDDLVDICVSVTRDSLFMAAASGSIVERCLTTGKIKNRIITIPPIEGFERSNGGTASIAFDDETGYLLAGGFYFGQIRAFRGDNLKVFRISELPNGVKSNRTPVTFIAALPGQNAMISGDAAGYLCYVSYDSDEIKKYWNNQHSVVTSLTVLSTEQLIVGYRNGSIELYNTLTWKLLSSTTAHDGPVTGAVLLPHTSLDRYLALPPTLHRRCRNSTTACSLCNETIESYFWFCPECKERVFISRCPSCRSKFRYGTYGIRCSSCGFNPDYGRFCY